MFAHLSRLLRPARSPLPVAQHAESHVQHYAAALPPSSTPAAVNLQQEIRQLAKALTLLHIAAGQGASGATTGADEWPFRQGLSATARQAEATMKSLRVLAPPQAKAWIELTQALTVVVLAADMLSEGQLARVLMPDTYRLLHRNAERALERLEAVYP